MFYPMFARRAFPCFDEPQFKTTFKLIVQHHESFNTVSNMERIDLVRNLCRLFFYLFFYDVFYSVWIKRQTTIPVIFMAILYQIKKIDPPFLNFFTVMKRKQKNIKNNYYAIYKHKTIYKLLTYYNCYLKYIFEDYYILLDFYDKYFRKIFSFSDNTLFFIRRNYLRMIKS